MVKVYEVMRSVDRLLALNVIGCILIVIGIMIINIAAGFISAGIACLLIAHEREVNNNEYSKNVERIS